MKRKCFEKYCRKKAGKNRRYCSGCRSRKFKESHPDTVYFNWLKQSAKKRGKEFTLTLAEFKQWWIDNDVTEVRKNSPKKTWSIDRIKNEEGYSLGNIRLLTVSMNSKKGVNPPPRRRLPLLNK